MLTTVYHCLKNRLPEDDLVKLVGSTLTAYVPSFPTESIATAVHNGLIPDTLPVILPPEYEQEVKFRFTLDPVGIESMEGRKAMYRGMKRIWIRWFVKGEWFTIRKTTAKIIHVASDGELVARIYLPENLFEDRDLLAMSCLSSRDDLLFFSPFVFEVESPEYFFSELCISPASKVFLTIEILHILRYVEPTDSISLWEQAVFRHVPPLVLNSKVIPLLGNWGFSRGCLFWKFGDSRCYLYIPPKLKEVRSIFSLDIEAWKRCIRSSTKRTECL